MPGAAQQLRLTTARPCSGRPRTPALWHEYPSLRLGTPAHARSVRPTCACHARACRASPESSLYKRDSTTVSTGHRWDGHSRAGSPTPASLDSHSPHGDKNASRYRSCVGVDGSAASGRLGGGTFGWVASCSQAAQGGLYVRPSKDLGLLERVRLNVMGTELASLGGDRAHRLGQA